MAEKKHGLETRIARPTEYVTEVVVSVPRDLADELRRREGVPLGERLSVIGPFSPEGGGLRRLLGSEVYLRFVSE